MTVNQYFVLYLSLLSLKCLCEIRYFEGCGYIRTYNSVKKFQKVFENHPTISYSAKGLYSK
jgi:hypothetical protein